MTVTAIVHLINQINLEQRHVIADHQTKPTDLGCEWADIVYTHHSHLLSLLRPKADTHCSR